jgi:hypothetical protein
LPFADVAVVRTQCDWVTSTLPVPETEIDT